MAALTIGIAMGDITGIGPEVTLKALALEPVHDDSRFVLIGDLETLREMNRDLGCQLDLAPHVEPGPAGRLTVVEPAGVVLNRPPAQGGRDAALAALAWLREGAERCLRGELDALVTAPVNKEAILRAGEPFIGQTEYLSGLAETDRTAMMLLGEDDRGRPLRVVLATTHLPLRRVADALTTEGIARAIELASLACRQLGLPRARVGVCGLNPHAGEGGWLGTEDQAVVAPAVEAARTRGIEVSGPHSADTLFHEAYGGGYDVVVAMYHDQGLGPLKMVAFEQGVNWTVGLPFIRTSPDHGTAYELAGRGTANPSSMRAAIRLARHLARSRTNCG
jgi:4-hydroxythreonine-4-phosphate dehydrogenase